MTPPEAAGGSLPSTHARRPARAASAVVRPPALAGCDSGMVMAVELVTATLVWGGIGWLADSWLATGPWLMSIGFVVGNFAGIYLLWLRSDPGGQRGTADARRDSGDG